MGHLKVNGKALLAMSGFDNAHALAMQSQHSYPTVKEYVEADKVRLDLAVLTGILERGAGLSVEEILNLRIGDVFTYVPEKESKKPGS